MIDYAMIGKALLHPTKRRILTVMTTLDGATVQGCFSPNELASVIDEPLGNVSYHVSDLAGNTPTSKFKESPVLELADTRPRRGAVEHFYRVCQAALVG